VGLGVETLIRGLILGLEPYVLQGSRDFVPALEFSGKRDRINTVDFVSKIRTATAAGPFDVSTDALSPTRAPTTRVRTTAPITVS
jgi:hypothetical protein